MKNLTYGEALKLFADNLDKSYYKYSGYIVELQDFVLLYNVYSSEIFVLEFINERFELKSKFGMETFFVYDMNRNGFIYIDDNSTIRTITVPNTKEDWFNFTLVHNCTIEDYKNFVKIVEYTSK